MLMNLLKRKHGELEMMMTERKKCWHENSPKTVSLETAAAQAKQAATTSGTFIEISGKGIRLIIYDLPVLMESRQLLCHYLATAITVTTMTKTITIVAISIITIMLVSMNEKIGDTKNHHHCHHPQPWHHHHDDHRNCQNHRNDHHQEREDRRHKGRVASSHGADSWAWRKSFAVTNGDQRCYQHRHKSSSSWLSSSSLLLSFFCNTGVWFWSSTRQSITQCHCLSPSIIFCMISLMR